MAAEQNKVDSLTGVSTTGHDWDGIHELNTPLPRWWLWLFYATIIWGIGYVIAYPALPLVSGVPCSGTISFEIRMAAGALMSDAASRCPGSAPNDA